MNHLGNFLSIPTNCAYPSLRFLIPQLYSFKHLPSFVPRHSTILCLSSASPSSSTSPSVRSALLTSSVASFSSFSFTSRTMQKLFSAFGFKKDEAKDVSADSKDAAATAESVSASSSTSSSSEDDCFACSIPCREYPEDIMKKIDYDDDIEASVKSYDRHLIVCTGIPGTEWPSRVDDQRGSFPTTVADAARKLKDAGLKVNVNSSEEESKDEKGEVIKDINAAKKADLILFPDMIKFHQVDEVRLHQVCEYIASPASKQWLDILRSGRSSSSSSSSSSLASSTLPTAVPGLNLPHSILSGVHVLVCVHMKRDARCGITAPILLQQFSDVSNALKIPSSSLSFHKISHVGGHKWAANVIVYPYGTWLGKVKPKHAEGILKTFVLNKGKGAEKMEEITRGNCRTKGIPAW